MAVKMVLGNEPIRNRAWEEMHGQTSKGSGMMHGEVHVKFCGRVALRVLALWRFKGFVYGMVWREFRGRYLGSLLGSVWSILNPVAMIFIYTIIFSQVMRARLAGVDDRMAYGIFLCAGVIPWGFFSELVSRSQNVFLEHANLLKKLSFPRITLPVIILLSSTVNFAIIFVILLVFLATLGRFPGWAILGFVPLLIVQQCLALGMGILLGTLNVFFRDIGHFVNIGLQFWFWLTPIVYPAAILPDGVRRLIELNPLAKLVVAYQEIILHRHWPHLAQFGPHTLSALVALAVGFVVFRRLSPDMVDEL